LLEVCPDAKWYHGGSARRVSAETLLTTFWEMAEDWECAVRWGQQHPNEVALIQPRPRPLPLEWLSSLEDE
jgi:hypothetical protein